MTDTEKVLKSLKACYANGGGCDNCEYWKHMPRCQDRLLKDTIAVIEQLCKE